MKELFIEKLTPETGMVTTFAQVARVDKKAKQDGELYLSIVLKDRTGEVPANLWDIPADLGELKARSVVKVKAVTGSYRDALQLKILQIRPAKIEEYAIEDFIPASKRDRDEMLAQLSGVVDTIIDQTLQDAVRRCIGENSIELRDAPAAKSVHQAYLGGLLEHILQLCKLADAVCSCYPALRRDILIAAAIIHDIGKLAELHYSDSIGYTRQGTLTGHIIQGSILWAKYSESLDAATRDHVQHIIASHHGNRDWGAAVLPMTREAWIFHLLDMIDAKYEMVTNAIDAGVDDNGLTAWQPKLESLLWDGR